jgi:di/tricarboxylate transporter
VPALLVALFVALPPLDPATLARFAGDPRAAVPVIVVGCLVLWSTSILPELTTSLIFFFACMLFQVAPAPVIFAGFSSPALWLVVGGMLISMAVMKLGLGSVLGAVVLRHVGRRYSTVLLVVVVAGAVLLPLVPSSIGRVLLIVPIVVALADALGLDRAAASSRRSAAPRSSPPLSRPLRCCRQACRT